MEGLSAKVSCGGTPLSSDAQVSPCNEPCHKCGSVDIGRRFIPKGGEVPSEGYDRCSSKYGTGQGHHWTATRDHIHHHCRCCQFEWQGPPLKKRKTVEDKT